MKICIVKHPYYMNFTWESARYESPEQMLKLFKYRSQNLTFVIGMKADVWIVEGKTVSPAFSLDKADPVVFKALYEAQPAVPWSTIPWDDYDIVITIDPILNKKQGVVKSRPNILWLYNEPSHRSGRAQAAAQHGPLEPYDLFWDDFMRAPHRVTKLPQSISFPYLANPDIMRALIKPTNDGGVFIDSRHVVEQPKGMRVRMVKEFQDICGVPVKYAPLEGQITEETRYSRSVLVIRRKMLECADYLKLMGSCKYYLVWRRKLTNGQGALEAAALGLIVIASDSAYSKMLCHPTCSIPRGGPARTGLRLIQKIEKDRDWQVEILAHQDKMLWKKFWNKPLEILSAALELKRNA